MVHRRCLVSPLMCIHSNVTRIHHLPWLTLLMNNAILPSGLIDKCTEKEIRSVVDGMVEQGLDTLGYKFINM